MNQADLLDCASELLALHAFRGADEHDLLALLNQCALRELEAGTVLCEEDTPGEELYFLLEGTVEVLKRDPRGQDRSLGVIEAPAILGHMSLVDRSKRSATCRAGEALLVAALDRPRFNHLFGAPSAEGSALRRLLAASIADQLARGNARLRALIAPDEEEISAEQVMAVEGQFSGWDVWGPDRSR